jgi:hypothetical protein
VWSVATCAEQAVDPAPFVAGQPMANMRHELTINVTKDGRPVTDLQPYLSTHAHLTAFHERVMVPCCPGRWPYPTGVS